MSKKILKDVLEAEFIEYFGKLKGYKDYVKNVFVALDEEGFFDDIEEDCDEEIDEDDDLEVEELSF